jgi:hypothetical protein
MVVLWLHSQQLSTGKNLTVNILKTVSEAETHSCTTEQRNATIQQEEEQFSLHWPSPMLAPCYMQKVPLELPSRMGELEADIWLPHHSRTFDRTLEQLDTNSTKSI